MMKYALPLILSLAACTTPGKTTPTVPIATGTVKPGTSVNRGGQPVALAKGSLDLDKPLPSIALTTTDWSPYTFKADGKVKLVSVVPSIDTKVCEQQTHLLGDSETLDKRVERVTVSRDLPAAQKRFAAEAHLANDITYLSDFKAGSFGAATGLLMPDSGLLARATLVVDGQGKVRYVQIVPELGNLPDLDQAVKVANELAAKAK